MSRRAFTLVELLVVVSIMIVLMSMVMVGIGIAKNAARKAKTTSLLGTVASAIDQYRGLNNVYPERLIVTATMVTDMGLDSTFTDKDVYDLVFSDGSGGVNAASAIPASGWEAANRALAWQLADLADDNIKDGLFIDTWKTPLRYRPSKWYPYDSGASARIDSDDPPAKDSYQLWSAGPDTTDDANPGEAGDDIPQWARKP